MIQLPNMAPPRGAAWKKPSFTSSSSNYKTVLMSSFGLICILSKVIQVREELR
jgi:hypothetical protein